jgi:hypothetical protein
MPVPAIAAIRRYVFGFVNSHDFGVCRELMSEDYRLHMGDSELVGRELAYIPAVQHQIGQFPDMGLTVHSVITDGRYVALHFSEHGRTPEGLVAAWPGVSIYEFDGAHLVQCWVEQDHHSRRCQLAEGTPIPLPPSSTAPFSGHVGTSDLHTDAIAREWLGNIAQWPPRGVQPDPGPHASPAVQLDCVEVVPNVVVATTQRFAFHATIWGNYSGSMPDMHTANGVRVPLHVSAVASVRDHQIEIDYMATNRVVLMRRLKNVMASGQPATRTADVGARADKAVAQNVTSSH